MTERHEVALSCVRNCNTVERVSTVYTNLQCPHVRLIFGCCVPQDQSFHGTPPIPYPMRGCSCMTHDYNNQNPDNAQNKEKLQHTSQTPLQSQAGATGSNNTQASSSSRVATIDTMCIINTSTATSAHDTGYAQGIDSVSLRIHRRPHVP